jgi:hypothetical protein
VELSSSCLVTIEHGVPGSLVGNVLVVGQRTHLMLNVPRWASVLGVYTLLATLFGVVAILGTRHQQTVAQEYLDLGIATAADGVEVDVQYGKGGSYIDTVEVTFVVATQRHVAALSNSLGDPEGNSEGRHPPAPGTRYAPPLRILYKPDDPSQVMALADAEDLAADTGIPSGSSGLVAIGGTISIAVAGGWLAYSRLQSKGNRRVDG